MTLLKINNLSAKYGAREVVRGVSFNVDEGDFLCLVGCNGSGKTTLISAILGLIKPSEGGAEFIVPRLSCSFLAQKSAIENDFPASVKEVIVSGLQNSTLKRIKNSEQRLANIVQELCIEPLLKKQISALSGGEKQIVCLARALIGEPKLIILDEPCAALDEYASKRVYEALKRRTQSRAGVLMVSHDLTGVKSYASRVAVLDTELKFCGDIGQWEQYRQEGQGHHFDSQTEESL